MTVGVISRNGKGEIYDCLASVMGQDLPNFRVLLIDIASDGGTADYVREHFPQVDIVRYPENHGPNVGRNLAIERAATDLVLLVDDDAVLRPNCLSSLVAAAQAHADGAVWAPRVVYHDRPDTIQIEGVRIHFVSEAILLNAERPVEEGFERVTRVATVAGICMLVSKPAWRDIGGFDEDYVFGRPTGSSPSA